MRVVGGTGAADGGTTGSGGSAGSSGSTGSTATDDAGAPTVDERLPDRLGGRYQIEREIGRGGCGRILRARDRHLGRTVAIKVPLPRPGNPRRLAREARITARLQHPSIIPVYEAGASPDGTPFYVMKLVEGRSLKDLVAEAPDFAARLALLPSVIAAVEAVAYAHRERVIHRDLKPSNVLVGAFGETIVLDWGLARELGDLGPAPAVADDERAGAVVGTPAYMSPEQAEGRAVDETADVYALGAALYHVLSGAPPAAGGGTPLAGVEAAAPRELTAIVDKAMAREPARRYPSAKELAEELRRFATGQLVRAHEYSLLALAGRFVRRHRAPVALGLAALAALATVAVVSARRIAAARDEAARRRDQLLVAQARATLPRDPTASLAWLGELPGGDDPAAALAVVDEAEDAGVARAVFARVGVLAAAPTSPWVALAADDGVRLFDPSSGASRRMAAAEGTPMRMAFSPDGRSLAALNRHGVWVWDVATGAVRRVGAVPEGMLIMEPMGIPWSPDGRLVASSVGRTVVVWDVASGRRTALDGHTADLFALAFSPDGRSIASTGADRTVRLWDLATGTGRVIGRHDAEVFQVRFSPDGRTVASAGYDGAVRLWSLDGGPERRLGTHAGGAYVVAFSPDGRRLASGGADHEIRLWDVASGEARVLRGHQGVVRVLAFTDGGALVSGSDDQTVRLWDPDAGEARLLRGHRGPVTIVAVGGGGWLATHAADGSARIWRLGPPGSALMARLPGMVVVLDFSPDGRSLAFAGGGEVGRCEIAPRRCVTLGAHPARVNGLRFSPDGRFVATAGREGDVWLWDAAGGGGRRLGSHGADVNDLAWAPDGRAVATASDDRTVREWDLAGGGRTVLRLDEVAYRIAYSRDGRWLACGTFGGKLAIADRASGAVSTPGRHDGLVADVFFSPDGRTLATAGMDRMLGLWDVPSGGGRLIPVGTALLWGAFAPDGRALATGGANGETRLWTSDGRPLRGLVSGAPLSRAGGFSPDGTLLAAAGDGSVRVWDVATGAPRGFRTADRLVRALRFSPDGRALAWGGEDGRVQLWTLPEARPGERGLAARLAALTTARLGADDQPETP